MWRALKFVRTRAWSGIVVSDVVPNGMIIETFMKYIICEGASLFIMKPNEEAGNL